MQVHLVTGRFGKSTIVPDARAAPGETARREARLRECVDHVRWHARRLAPGRVLVITHAAIEAAFADIPGVVTGHFNAMAGLDAFGNVAAVFIVGRPLPPEAGLTDPAAALFEQSPQGRYVWRNSAVRMRDGMSRAVRVPGHADQIAERIRAAICDDELIQCIGRGRGVNRTAANPLEVHVLADVALPLVHDSVTGWETVQPDAVQRMLLAGIAVDSPADAAALHPGLFDNPEMAKKVFHRIGFKGQIPLGTYRGMSLKCAAYRRSGRGRGWQRAFWLPGSSDSPRQILESRLGPLAAFEERPDRRR